MISIVIPVYNEEGVIGNTLRHLKSITGSDHVMEVIVCDGGSEDDTVNEARLEGATVISSDRKGRAAQMNAGASASKGSILYFLHADSVPPDTFPADIVEAVQRGFPAGCYRLRFDLEHWFLKANAWFSRFDINAFRYGDQSLFVERKYFEKVGGFCEKHIVMEDNDIIRRLRKHAKFIILRKHVITSGRKYVTNGVYKMQGIFYLIYFLYRIGYPQNKLVRIFRKVARQDKI